MLDHYNINISSIVQFDPFSQLHPNKILKDYVQFKGFQTYPFESVFLQKGFFEELEFFVAQHYFGKFSLKWWFHIIETYIKIRLKMK